jgi:hypothetical protein
MRGAFIFGLIFCVPFLSLAQDNFILPEKVQSWIVHLSRVRRDVRKLVEPVVALEQKISAIGSQIQVYAPEVDEDIVRPTPQEKSSVLWWLGNADTPEPPNWYRPNENFREQLWYFRNPLHNFSNYVVGIKDKSNSPQYRRYGRFPSEVFAPEPGWNYAFIRYGRLTLPFVSYWNEDLKVYLGWRERGNLGAKVNFGPDDE